MKERNVEIILWDWLMTKKINVIQVYFNRKNELNGPIFNTSGINEKPDFLVSFDRGFGIEYIAIEIKSSNRSKDVHDSGKILRYYENYITKKTVYYINEKSIELKHFAVMTEQSIQGHLFKEENEIKDNLSNEGEQDAWRKFNAEHCLIPQYEYVRTSDYLRRLWSEWRNLKKRLNVNKDLPSIGIVISNPKKDEFPYYFSMIYTSWMDNKSWKQRFWRL
jgi:hypothetical protein